MKAILACDRAGGIGYEGGLPWPKNEKDLARFKQLTQGQTVIMGRSTWESKGMPKPLPGRTNVIVSSANGPIFDTSLQKYDAENNNMAIYDGKPNTNIAQVWDLAGYLKDQADCEECWIIGGARLIAAAWDSIDEIHLSRMRQEFKCDTYINLERIHAEFEQHRSQLCLTHHYEIWKRIDGTELP